MSLDPYVLHTELLRLRNQVDAESTRLRTAGAPSVPNPRKMANLALSDSLSTALLITQVLLEMDLADPMDYQRGVHDV